MEIRRVLALFALACGVAAATDYAPMLDALWTQSDANEDGVLSQTEFVSANEKLGIPASTYTLHQSDYSVFFVALDADSSGGLTQTELADAVTNYPTYKDPLVKAFTGGALDMDVSLDSILPTQELIDAAVVLVQTIIVSGSSGDIYPGQRDMIKAQYADNAGVPVTSVLTRFDTVDAERRRLQSGASTEITVTIYFATEADATAAESELAADPASTAAFDGLEVESYTPPESSSTTADLPFSTVGMVGAVLVIASCFLCANSTFWSGRKAKANKAAGVAPSEGGCCTAGCCSFNAVKPWAFGELVACLAIVGTVFFLYTEVTGVTNAIIGLVETFLEMYRSNVSLIADVSNNIPATLINTLEQQIGQMRLLPLATMVPGLLAAFFLFLGSACPLYKGHKGSYCGTKCMILLADLFLILSLVVYILFAVFAIFVAYVPRVQVEVKAVKGFCTTVPNTLVQISSDISALQTKLTSTGQPMPADFADTISDLETAATLVDQGCGHIKDFIDELIGVFLPGLMCVVAILFAMFVNQTLCCATGCCKSPPKTAPTTTKKAGGDVDATLQNI